MLTMMYKMNLPVTAKRIRSLVSCFFGWLFFYLPAFYIPSCAAYGQRPSGSAGPAAPLSIQLEQWSADPKLHVLNDRYQKEPAVVIMDSRRYEYIDDKDTVIVYKTLHKIIRVNDDKGIESYNRIYLGVTDNNDIVDIRARTILPGGKIIEVDKQNIKDLKEENGNLYKIFAMEGLEKGCELEYYYTFKRYTSFFGKETLQGSFPVLDSRLEILAPERLLFEMKGYNYSVTPADTVLNGKKSLLVTVRDIPGVDEEKYASYTGNLRRVEFKLSHNTAITKGSERLFTWNELAQRIYRNYSSYTDAEMKAAAELAGINKWDRLGSDQEKIIAIEDWLKKNYATREDIDGDNADNVEKIIKSRIASKRGITRVYGAIFRKLGIDFQYVLTCDRSNNVIDRSFENWDNASYMMLYFPTTKKFLAPGLLATRYPWINPYWGGGDALYCRNTTIGNFTTAIALIKIVPLEDYAGNYNNVESNLTLNAGNDTLLVDMKQLYGGYSAIRYRANYTLATPDDQRKLVKEMVKFGTNSENIVESEISNADFGSFGDNKPFQLHAKIKTGELLETAGNKLLVKIGDLIGPQTEMYQEKPRQFPMTLAYPHFLERKINFIVPAGYTASNLDALNINHVYTDKGDTTVSFNSSYSHEGDTIKIHVMEQYRRIYYPLDQYELFKQVINAAADFNKIVLVLEKKD